MPVKKFVTRKMKDEAKTKTALIEELEGLRIRVKRLEETSAQPKNKLSSSGEADLILRAFFENSHIMAALMDSQFNFIWVSPSYALADEKEQSFFEGKNHFELYPNAENEAIFREVVKTGEVHHYYAKPFEYEANLERGVTYWNWSLIPVKDDDDAVKAVLLTLRNVTERKRMEAELSRIQDKYEALHSAMSEGVAVHKLEYDASGNPVDYTIIDVNFGYEKILGITKESALQAKASELYGTGEAPYLEIFSKVAFTGEPESFDTFFQPLNRHFFISVFSHRKGVFTTVFSDITSTKFAENKLKRVNRAYRVLNEVNENLIRADNAIEFLNNVCRIIIEHGGYRFAWVGLTEETGSKKVCPAAYAGDKGDFLKDLDVSWADDESGRGPTGRSIRSGKPYICNDMRTDEAFKPWRERALKLGYVSSISIPLFEERGPIGVMNIYSSEPDDFEQEEVILFQELAKDVAYGVEKLKTKTDLDDLVTELSESRKTLTNIMSNVPGMIYRCINNRNWTMEFVSEGCIDLTGYHPSEIMNDNVISFNAIIHPEYRDYVWKEVQKVVENKGTFQIEYKIITAEGEEKWVWERGVGEYNEKNEATHLEGFITEITSSKKAEEELKESEFKYRSLIDRMEDGVFLIVGERVELFNTKLKEWFGLEDSDRGKEALPCLEKFMLPDSLKRALEAYKQVMKGDDASHRFEFTALSKEGKEMHLEVSLSPAPSGGKPSIQGIVRDITERRKLEEQFRQAQKMEAVGRLAGSVAHDFNNMLTVISGNTELATMILRKDNPVKDYLDQIKRAALNATKLTNSLLTFSRRQKVELRVLDLNVLVKDITKMLRSLIEENIELRTKLTPNIRRVEIDTAQIEQVIINLAVNARDAMPNGGILTLETKSVMVDEKLSKKYLDLDEGQYVELTFSDSGSGMTDEVKSRIFDPFFTTKEKGKGTGLGLSTVYGIVKQHGGSIHVYSEEGYGSTFTVYLPVAKGEKKETEKSRTQSVIHGGDENILVVEDETEVREFILRVLTRFGYKVIAASNGKEAMEICNAGEMGFDLLLTDVVMPGMSGVELAKFLNDKYPGIKILLTSGYTEETIDERGGKGLKYNMLNKPFSPMELAEKVREKLDS